ncbi:MAG: MazG-like family protein [Anaerolineaceae bacterium]|nr:MazG-like family protein [Anaerolineaceae bacterium]
MNIKDLQEQANELKSKQNWDGHTLEHRAMFLVTEVGEVIEEVLKLSSVYKDVDQDEAKERLGMEIYDVIWNLCDLANIVGIDLETTFEKKMAINRGRKW